MTEEEKNEIKIENYEYYWQKGGIYVLPIEVFNELFYDIEQLQQKNNILTEFEKWLEEEKKKENWKYGDMYFNEFANIALKKLQELKKGGKE